MKKNNAIKKTDSDIPAPFIRLENRFNILDFKNCNELIVFAVINSFCKTYNYYAGGYTYLSRHFPMSKSTVIRTIKSLVERKYILEIPGRYNASNKYQINDVYIDSIFNRYSQSEYTQYDYTQTEYSQSDQRYSQIEQTGIVNLTTSKNISNNNSKIDAQNDVLPVSDSINQEDNAQTTQPSNLPATVKPSAPSPKKRKKPEDDLPEDLKEIFVEFWQAYPKKRLKDECCTIWKKLKPDAELFAVIIKALKDQKQYYDWKKKRGEFVAEFPDPPKWLNKRYWNNEVEAPPPTQTATDRIPKQYKHNTQEEEDAIYNRLKDR